MEIFGEHFSWLEIWGTLFGIAGVLLTVIRSVYCFPVGIVNVGLYALLFFESRLYADACLQVVYIALLTYGWIRWGREGKKEFVAATTRIKEWVVLAVVCVLSTILIGTLFKTYTDASLPYLDSLLTSASLIAQWMVARKKIANWMIWIAADTVYVGMYIYKELYITAVLYFIFIFLAMAGYREWKGKLNAR
jgi:nicotinamide mononucleotide transporter